MMKNPAANVRLPVRPSVLLIRLVLLAALNLLALSGCVAPDSATAVQPAMHSVMAAQPVATSAESAGLVPDSALAERYGIQVTLIGITAAGGVIDFRYRVVNPDKAMEWLKDPKLMPDLVVEGRDVILTHPEDTMKEMGEVQVGQVRYMLYPNAGGIVKPGTSVSVAIGDTHFGPYAAQQ